MIGDIIEPFDLLAELCGKGTNIEIKVRLIYQRIFNEVPTMDYNKLLDALEGRIVLSLLDLFRDCSLLTNACRHGNGQQAIYWCERILPKYCPNFKISKDHVVHITGLNDGEEVKTTILHTTKSTDRFAAALDFVTKQYYPYMEKTFEETNKYADKIIGELK